MLFPNLHTELESIIINHDLFYNTYFGTCFTDKFYLLHANKIIQQQH